MHAGRPSVSLYASPEIKLLNLVGRGWSNIVCCCCSTDESLLLKIFLDGDLHPIDLQVPRRLYLSSPCFKVIMEHFVIALMFSHVDRTTDSKMMF